MRDDIPPKNHLTSANGLETSKPVRNAKACDTLDPKSIRKAATDFESNRPGSVLAEISETLSRNSDLMDAVAARGNEQTSTSDVSMAAYAFLGERFQSVGGNEPSGLAQDLRGKRRNAPSID